MKKNYLILLLVLLLLPFVSASYPTGYNYCKNIIISNPTGEALTNFPVNLNVTFDSPMQTDFDDLRFYNGSCGGAGNILLAELENKTDSTNAYIWINTNLSIGNNMFAMYYGNSSNSANWDNTGSTWNNNFIAVFHKNSLLDSSLLKLNGSSSGASRTSNGIWSSAYSYDGINDIITLRKSID